MAFLLFSLTINSSFAKEDCLKISGTVKSVHKIQIEASHYQTKILSNCNVPSERRKVLITDEYGRKPAGLIENEKQKFILPHYEEKRNSILRINVIEN